MTRVGKASEISTPIGRLLALDDRDQLAHHTDPDSLAALDRDQRLFGLVAVTAEEQDAVDPAVGAFFLAAIGPRLDQRHGPPLELVLVAPCKVERAFEVLRRAVNLERDARKRILEPPFDQRIARCVIITLDRLGSQ